MILFYLFIVLPVMLIFSAIVTVLGATVVTLVSTFRRGKTSPATQPVVEPETFPAAAGFFAEIPVEPAPRPAPAAPHARQYTPPGVITTMKESLASMPATFFVAKDVTLALRQRVSYKGEWLKYADLPYIVVGPRRLHLVFEPDKLSPKREAGEDLERAAYLASRFLKLHMGLEFTVRCWLVDGEKPSPKDKFRSVAAGDVTTAIQKFEKSPLGRDKEPTSTHFEEIVEALRACQPQDMRPFATGEATSILA